MKEGGGTTETQNQDYDSIKTQKQKHSNTERCAGGGGRGGDDAFNGSVPEVSFSPRHTV